MMSLLCAALVIIVDQVLKNQALLAGNAVINPGVAFSMGTVLLATVGIVTLSSLLAFERRYFSLLTGLLIASLSNMADRWRHGGVIDYIKLGDMSFNLADALILVFTALLIYSVATNKSDTR